MHIPTDLLLTTDQIPQEFVQKHAEISVHGLLASFLSHASVDDLERHGLWRATWPTEADFANSMPILLPERLRHPFSLKGNEIESPIPLLPPAICGAWIMAGGKMMSSAFQTSLVAKQETKMKRDWNDVRDIFPNTNFEAFQYNWLIVNTRSFYYDLPLRYKPKSNDDRMILCPFVDYFNHADDGVRISTRAAYNN